MDYEERIVEVLKRSSDGLNINDIAKKAGISKTAAIKYLATFKMARKADYSESGSSRLWRLMIPKEEKAAIFTGKKIDAEVKEFAEENDLLGFAVVNDQGQAISAVLPKDMNTEKLGAFAAFLSETRERTADLANLGIFKQAILEMDKGKILAYNAGKMLLLAFSKSENPSGTLLSEMEKFAEKIK